MYYVTRESQVPRAVGTFDTRFLEEPGGDRSILVTRSNFRFIDSKHRRWTLRVSGRPLDGASIPRLLWTAVGGPFEGDHRIPSLLHDEAYATKRYPRDIADRMFYEALRYYGVNAIKARTMWFAVRVFGAKPWNDK
jgi:uncharacterized protein DUF1353